MSGIGKRLKKIREYLGYSQNEFAKKLGLKQNTISAYENDRLDVSGKVLSWLAYNKINLSWLFTGEGEMFLEDNDFKNTLKEIKEKGITLEEAKLLDIIKNNEIIRKNLNAMINNPKLIEYCSRIASLNREDKKALEAYLEVIRLLKER